MSKPDRYQRLASTNVQQSNMYNSHRKTQRLKPIPIRPTQPIARAPKLQKYLDLQLLKE